MKVTLLDHMGSDLTVVNAARVSFDKESDWVYCGGHSDGRDKDLSVKDKKLIKYLAEHNHWSPFSHCFVQFRVKAPIFVARQLQKHQVGLAWNEVSRRYVDSDPEFYEPEVWRAKADNVKQGSADDAVPFGEEAIKAIRECLDLADDTYSYMIGCGVCPEQARMVLPQSMYCEWVWSGSLYAFARVVNLRLDPHSQRETQEVAKQIAEFLHALFPVSYNALCN